MLDPAIERFLPLLQSGPKLHELSPRAARAAFAALRDPGEPPPVRSIEERQIPGPRGPISVRIYRDCDSAELPGVLYFHGGGWVVGDLDTHDVPCRRLARESSCAILSVDYRLAPETPFPGALEDAFGALEWLAGAAHTIGVDPSRLAVAGDSAGANLAAAVCLRAREQGNVPLLFQLLIYPVTDHDFARASYADNGIGYLLETDTMRWFWDQYVPNAAERTHPLASPLRAESLAGLPPAFILTAGYDPLRDEGEAYAERLSQAGVRTRLERYESLIHGFISFATQVPSAAAALSDAARALQTALRPESKASA